jgi:hypothetical protein
MMIEHDGHRTRKKVPWISGKMATPEDAGFTVELVKKLDRLP